MTTRTSGKAIWSEESQKAKRVSAKFVFSEGNIPIVLLAHVPKFIAVNVPKDRCVGGPSIVECNQSLA
ncbi:MAG: hypothetical protein AMJ65_05920 [Phycisphaerae bacterium SG8_4]|nr:MAG: hypothetical protein AMJ65_05920 [Phycisphaerae bacterium SG8_4]